MTIRASAHLAPQRSAWPFDTVLVANRGEIALRIMRTAKTLGLRTVAVYSEADIGLPHTQAADCAICIGPAPARESYLAIDRVMAAARASGTQAIHPGYGFLSESEAFAVACRDAGLIFIGPSAETIRAMGNKAIAKRIMRDCGIACLPGYDGADQEDAALVREAAAIGWPVVVKAMAGGGGKGMRLVASAAELPEALRAARSEALKAFGDGALMLEQAVIAPRHVEVQVFGDTHGNVVSLGDRDCSLQRRHQKIIEEAPAPGLSQAVRARMAEAAVKAARAVRYAGMGTVEFLVSGDRQFFFLEMNPRLQVEHPVTEAITGLDLVEWQFRIAAGERLPLEQGQIGFDGHAIEARIYAEDPSSQFLPQSGPLVIWRPPAGRGVRVDHGLSEGAFVSTHYDPMIAKVIAHGADRDQARRCLANAITQFAIGGVQNNLAFLRRCLLTQEFTDAAVDTGFLERNPQVTAASCPDRILVAVAGALFQVHAVQTVDVTLRNWRSRPWRPEALTLISRSWRRTLRIAAEPGGITRVQDDAGTMEVRILATTPELHVRVNGLDYTMHQAWSDNALHLVHAEHSACFAELRPLQDRVAAKHGAVVLSPMPGSIVDVRVTPGARVEAGQVVLILEGMKMEHQIRAPISGRIATLGVSAGQQVGMRDLLVEVAPEEAQGS
jgi:geranyl-CoA carboxylase alpha subunit